MILFSRNHQFSLSFYALTRAHKPDISHLLTIATRIIFLQFCKLLQVSSPRCVEVLFLKEIEVKSLKTTF